MKRDPNFEASADMRLVELSRTASGKAIPVKSRWQSRGNAEAGSPVIDEELAPLDGSLVVATLHSTPSADVIPGAVLTVTLALNNEGGEDARDILIGSPLPGATRVRPGSLVMDGRPAAGDVAEAFFGAGYALRTLAGGSRTTFYWQLEVLAGTDPVIISGNVRATGSAVIVPTSLRISRRVGATGAFTASVATAIVPPAIEELPIYELDEEEILVHEAVSGPYDATPEPRRATKLEPEPEPKPEPEPEPEPEPVQIAAQVMTRATILLTTTIDRASLAFFERVFNGSSAPSLLDHLTFASQLACVTQQPVAAGDDVEIRKHQEAQAQLLARIALHERLKKRDALTAYAGTRLCTFETLRERPLPSDFRLAAPTSTCILALEPSNVGLATLVRLGQQNSPWDFLRARQLTHALGAATVLNEGIPPTQRSLAEQAFRGYSQASANALQRLFVRQRIERSTAVLLTNDPSLDAAARQIIAVLTEIAR